jgi:adiponectin receptor
MPLTPLFGDLFEPDPRGKPGFCYTATDAPVYLRERYVMKRYRAHLTLFQCIQSVLVLHNETFDIWSHGLAAILFWALTIDAWQAHGSQLPVLVFCASKALVFTCSFIAHTFSPVNAKLKTLVYRLDWSAIALAIMGSSTAIICFGFHCSPSKQWYYMLGTAVPCLFLFCAANTAWFHQLETTGKTAVALALVPTICAVAMDLHFSMSAAEKIRFLRPMCLPMAVTVIGLAIYAFKLPERLSPGSFDMLFRSHNFHHIWTTAFAVLMYMNVCDWHEWRTGTMCPA